MKGDVRLALVDEQTLEPLLSVAVACAGRTCAVNCG
jgi:hypothetical protein